MECLGRFISTCVEQTSQGLAPCATTTVHLHVRGADCWRFDPEVLDNGSSPRAWSRPLPFWVASLRKRFISTCVEQTARRARRPYLRAVHLHVRGADLPAAPTARHRPVHLHVRGADLRRAGWRNANTGSSPRAWSRHVICRDRRRCNRFISTCVEQTGNVSICIRAQSVHLHVRGADTSNGRCSRCWPY